MIAVTRELVAQGRNDLALAWFTSSNSTLEQEAVYDDCSTGWESMAGAIAARLQSGGAIGAAEFSLCSSALDTVAEYDDVCGIAALVDNSNADGGEQKASAESAPPTPPLGLQDGEAAFCPGFHISAALRTELAIVVATDVAAPPLLLLLTPRAAPTRGGKAASDTHTAPPVAAPTDAAQSGADTRALASANDPSGTLAAGTDSRADTDTTVARAAVPLVAPSTTTPGSAALQYTSVLMSHSVPFTFKFPSLHLADHPHLATPGGPAALRERVERKVSERASVLAGAPVSLRFVTLYVGAGCVVVHGRMTVDGGGAFDEADAKVIRAALASELLMELMPEGARVLDGDTAALQLGGGGAAPTELAFIAAAGRFVEAPPRSVPTPPWGVPLLSATCPLLAVPTGGSGLVHLQAVVAELLRARLPADALNAVAHDLGMLLCGPRVRLAGDAAVSRRVVLTLMAAESASRPALPALRALLGGLLRELDAGDEKLAASPSSSSSPATTAAGAAAAVDCPPCNRPPPLWCRAVFIIAAVKVAGFLIEGEGVAALTTALLGAPYGLHILADNTRVFSRLPRVLRGLDACAAGRIDRVMLYFATVASGANPIPRARDHLKHGGDIAMLLGFSWFERPRSSALGTALALLVEVDRDRGVGCSSWITSDKFPKTKVMTRVWLLLALLGALASQAQAQNSPFPVTDYRINSACRTKTADGSLDAGSANVAYVLYYRKDLAQCLEQCMQTPGCTGVEHNPTNMRCEVWTVPILGTDVAGGYNCYMLAASQTAPQTGAAARRT
ncbi:hypothetical protein FOA52_012748 [Chlamydomonas sp. UWO 241]|nr:hypothetical protein FOA52_012748 [Chlamydomonas sp. UWO 241]